MHSNVEVVPYPAWIVKKTLGKFSKCSFYYCSWTLSYIYSVRLSIKESADHIKCVSEVEKYAGTGWKAPANFNKGEKKQQAWVDTVSDALKNGGGTLTPACKSLLQAISKHDNVPRKKPKFFVSVFTLLVDLI